MYQALYRKYRPKTFDDVVGQKVVVETLKNSINHEKVNHAYLFYGPRGIGKTTIAKIFSRAVNCLKNNDGNPCNQCEMCKKSLNSVDIIEIDAASNNGVDEIREIRNKVNLVPTELKYKVYIIDEVHMLTTGAFNALLKTLEEPPKHVIFVLATTDLQKVSDTIISRCQCFSFKKISIDNNILKLKDICKKEKISISDDTLNLIAEYSEGGLRDSIGLLDKISSYKNDNIDVDDFYELNDMISKKEIEIFQNYILNKNYEGVIESIRNYSENGKNLIEIISQLLYNIRNCLINHYLNKNKDNKVDLLVTLANTINEKMFDIKKCSNPKIYIETMLLNFMYKQENNENELVENYFPGNNLEKEVNNRAIKETENEKIKKNKSNIDQIMKIRVNNVLSTATKTEKQSEIENFKKLKDYVFDQKYGSIASELLNGNVCAASEFGIIISFEYESVVQKNIKNITLINKVYNKLLDNSKKLAIISQLDWQKTTEEYIKNKKKGKKYDIIKEPDLIELVDDSKQDEKSINSMDAFKEIIEME